MSRLSGLLTKRILIKKALDGSFRFTGTVIAKSKEITTGILSQFTGALTKKIRIGKALTGLWYATGALTKRIRIQKNLSGVLGFTGVVTASVTEVAKESIAGLLNLTGTLTKRIRQSKVVAGTIGFVGTLSIVGATFKSFAGSMKMTSSLVARPIVTETMYYGVENP